MLTSSYYAVPFRPLLLCAASLDQDLEQVLRNLPETDIDFERLKLDSLPYKRACNNWNILAGLFAPD
jgi:hypothetical protein